MVVGHFLSGSHSLMVTALDSCIKLLPIFDCCSITNKLYVPYSMYENINFKIALLYFLLILYYHTSTLTLQNYVISHALGCHRFDTTEFRM